jgi:hypothetical protein
MTKRALLPGEQEAWERACAEERWVVRASGGYWWHGGSGPWSSRPNGAAYLTRHDAKSATFSGDTVAYRARSVRADGTPVVP